MTRWLGRERVLKRIRALPQAVRDNIRGEIAGGADMLVDAMRRAAPKKSGDLAKSIIWEWGSKSNRRGALAEFTVTVHLIPPGLFYGHVVEFGASPHENKGVFAGTQNPGFAREPFFYPTYRANKRTLVKRYKKAVRQGIIQSKGS